MATTTRYYTRPTSLVGPTYQPVPFAAVWLNSSDRAFLSTTKRTAVSELASSALDTYTQNPAYAIIGPQYQLASALPVRTISGRFTWVTKFNRNSATPSGDIYIRIAVFSSDGLTLRGVLFEGVPTGPTATTTVQTGVFSGEFTPVTVQSGDLLVFERGARWANAVQFQHSIDIPTRDDDATADFAATNGLTGAGNPWLDITVDDIPNPPTGLTMSVVGGTTATATFTAPASGPTPTSYQYRVDGGSAVSNALSTTISLTGLTANAAHTLEARSVQGGTASSWSSVVNFTTLPVVTTRYYMPDNDNATATTPAITPSALWFTTPAAGGGQIRAFKRLTVSKPNLNIQAASASKPGTLPNSSLARQLRTPALSAGTMSGTFRLVFSYAFIGISNMRCIVRQISSDGATVRASVADVSKAFATSSTAKTVTLEGTISGLTITAGDVLVFEIGGAVTSGLGGSLTSGGTGTTSGVADPDWPYVDGTTDTDHNVPWIETIIDAPAATSKLYLGATQSPKLYLGSTQASKLYLGTDQVI